MDTTNKATLGGVVGEVSKSVTAMGVILVLGVGIGYTIKSIAGIGTAVANEPIINSSLRNWQARTNWMGVKELTESVQFRNWELGEIKICTTTGLGLFLYCSGLGDTETPWQLFTVRYHYKVWSRIPGNETFQCKRSADIINCRENWN